VCVCVRARARVCMCASVRVSNEPHYARGCLHSSKWNPMKKTSADLRVQVVRHTLGQPHLRAKKESTARGDVRLCVGVCETSHSSLRIADQVMQGDLTELVCLRTTTARARATPHNYLSLSHLRIINGILPSLSSFMAILRGSDSLPTLVRTGAFMLI
jgi:hypothetical protein